MALTTAQKAALAQVANAAASRSNGRTYEVESELVEAGVTIHFTPKAEGSNQGRFWFAVNGEDTGIDYTSRGAARKGAREFLALVAGDAPAQA